MRCVACDAEVPTGAKFCPNCGAAMRTQPGGIDTGGGAFVGGGVQTGGDFIGRDQTIHGGYTRTTQHGLSGTEVANRRLWNFRELGLELLFRRTA